jgi:hypothetical protein
LRCGFEFTSYKEIHTHLHTVCTYTDANGVLKSGYGYGRL